MWEWDRIHLVNFHSCLMFIHMKSFLNVEWKYMKNFLLNYLPFPPWMILVVPISLKSSFAVTSDYFIFSCFKQSVKVVACICIQWFEHQLWKEKKTFCRCLHFSITFVFWHDMRSESRKRSCSAFKSLRRTNVSESKISCWTHPHAIHY